MRYNISFNAASKVILGALGMGPSRSWVEVRPDEIYGQMGWGGHVRIPRRDILSVERIDHVPWWIGFGIHGLFGAWAFNGAVSGAVKITMRRPAKALGAVIFIPIRPHTVYFSLEQPEEFVHEATRGFS